MVQAICICNFIANELFDRATNSWVIDFWKLATLVLQPALHVLEFQEPATKDQPGRASH